jgi:hypothetical protein
MKLDGSTFDEISNSKHEPRAKQNNDIVYSDKSRGILRHFLPDASKTVPGRMMQYNATQPCFPILLL